MEMIGIIASVVAAIAAIAGLWFSLRSSKGSILKRIDRKEQQIREIDNAIIQRFGLNGGNVRAMTPMDAKRNRLCKEIAELKRKL